MPPSQSETSRQQFINISTQLHLCRYALKSQGYPDEIPAVHKNDSSEKLRQMEDDLTNALMRMTDWITQMQTNDMEKFIQAREQAEQNAIHIIEQTAPGRIKITPFYLTHTPRPENGPADAKQIEDTFNAQLEAAQDPLQAGTGTPFRIRFSSSGDNFITENVTDPSEANEIRNNLKRDVELFPTKAVNFFTKHFRF